MNIRKINCIRDVLALANHSSIIFKKQFLKPLYFKTSVLPNRDLIPINWTKLIITSNKFIVFLYFKKTNPVQLLYTDP